MTSHSIAVAALTVVVSLAGASAGAIAAESHLDAATVRKLIVGHTMVVGEPRGRDNKMTYSFSPDGHVNVLHGGLRPRGPRRYTTTWTLQPDGMLCIANRSGQTGRCQWLRRGAGGLVTGGEGWSKPARIR